MSNNIKFHYLSHKGKKRNINEDAVSVPTWNPEILEKCEEIRQKGFFFILCDGMGGHKAGNVAIHFCSNWLLKDFYDEKKITSLPKWLNSKIIEINNRIYQLSLEKEEYLGMGTTVVTLLIKGNKAYINNVGDSRLYLYSNEKFEQITEDHSLVMRYYKQNLITKEEMLTSKLKHVLTQAIGLKKEPDVNCYTMNLPKEYCFLLCSDGLSDVARDNEIKEILEKKNDIISTTEKLYELSQKKLSNDDVSILLVTKNFCQ